MWPVFHAPRYAARSYALLRFMAGWLFAFHGAQKMFGLFRPDTPAFGSQIWWGGLIELVCGALIAAGVLTRLAAFLASGTMAVAYVQFHWKFAFDANFWPAINKGELALVYAFLFLFISAYGPGIWSVDEWRARRSGKATGGPAPVG